MRRHRLAIGGLVLIAALVVSACQPARQTTGPGSKAGYISTSATKTDTGDGNNGTRVYTFVPNVLKGGTKAPVVVVLHGFELLAPEIYQGLIDHLNHQGYIVIFPAYNKGGFGILDDTDQNAMLGRAIASTNSALGALGSKADTSKVFLFGHSLGGLVAASWTGRGGVAPAGIVLANPSTSGAAGIPDFLSGLVTVTPIPWQSLVPATTAKTVVLTGDKDTIAPPAEAIGIYDKLTSAAARSVYELQNDTTETKPIQADHMAPIQNQGIVPDLIMNALGGDAEEDNADWRYYWAALDQMLAGNATPTFSMGTWGNGTPVKPVLKLR